MSVKSPRLFKHFCRTGYNLLSEMKWSVISISIPRHIRLGAIFTVVFDTLVGPHVIFVVWTRIKSLSTYITVKFKLSRMQLHVLVQAALPRIRLAAIHTVKLFTFTSSLMSISINLHNIQKIKLKCLQFFTVYNSNKCNKTLLASY